MEWLDDLSLATIARFLAHTRASQSLMHLAQTNSRMNAVCAPIIEEYVAQCMARLRCIRADCDFSVFEFETYDEDGRLHSYRDQYSSGLVLRRENSWHCHGQLHRIGGPAVIRGDRSEWWQNGMRHRDDDLPAIEVNWKGVEWWVHGVRHRDGDEPAFDQDGDQIWFKHGQIHRDGDKPAFISADGTQEWRQHGVLHRENGPAHVGKARLIWYLHGKEIKDEPSKK